MTNTRSANEPLGTNGDQGRRLLWHHVPLALASATVFVLWTTLPLFQAAQDQDPMSMARITTATGYVALGLLAFTLLIGPANLLLRRRNPVSNYLRRDAGAWTAMVSVLHVIVGLHVHLVSLPLGERVRRYFLTPNGTPLTNSFGLGNWTGLTATVIVVGLLAISSDLALRKLKAGPWKWLQRLNYALCSLVIAHAIFYGALRRVTSPSTRVLGLSVIAVLVAQAVGVWRWRRVRGVPRGVPPD